MTHHNLITLGQCLIALARQGVKAPLYRVLKFIEAGAVVSISRPQLVLPSSQTQKKDDPKFRVNSSNANSATQPPSIKQTTESQLPLLKISSSSIRSASDMINTHLKPKVTLAIIQSQLETVSPLTQTLSQPPFEPKVEIVKVQTQILEQLNQLPPQPPVLTLDPTDAQWPIVQIRAKMHLYPQQELIEMAYGLQVILWQCSTYNKTFFKHHQTPMSLSRVFLYSKADLQYSGVEKKFTQDEVLAKFRELYEF